MNQRFSVAKYVRQYVAPFLRQPRFLALLTAFVAPIQSARDRLTDEIYPAQERAARFNSQVIRLEKILRTVFAEPTITLSADGQSQVLYVFNTIENHATVVSNAAENQPVYVYQSTEYYAEYDFTVNVPASLYASSLPRLRATVLKYKITGVTFRIRAIN